MKKLAVITIVAAFCATMAACNGKTELAITNGANSQNNVNELVWANDTKWEKDGGYGIGDKTSSKEVDKTSGTITGTVYNGTEFVTADIINETTGAESFVLSEGSSNTVTIRATLNTANKQ
jgi:hypothetical protein